MQATILLNVSDTTSKIEEEEKNRFLRNLLSNMGLMLDFWAEETLILDVDQKSKLRKLLLDNSLQIIDDFDGDMKVYFQKDLVAHWEKPIYKLKTDTSKLNHRKQFYVEMAISYSTIYDQ